MANTPYLLAFAVYKASYRHSDQYTERCSESWNGVLKIITAFWSTWNGVLDFWNVVLASGMLFQLSKCYRGNLCRYSET
jgi:hypothetical protein